MDIIELIDKHLSSINITSKEVEDEFILDTNTEYHKKQLIGLIDKHLEEKYKENQDIIISHKHFVRNLQETACTRSFGENLLQKLYLML